MVFDEHLNLDFMIEDNNDDNLDIQELIQKEIFKSVDDKLSDHKKFDGNHFLRNDTDNGFMMVALNLFSLDK